MLSYFVLLDIEAEDEGSYIYDDDIILDYNEYDGLNTQNMQLANSIPTAEKRIKLWDKEGPHVMIPFKIKANVPPNYLTHINKALGEYNTKTCLR